MSDSLTIRQALPDEASFLSGLALRSKAHWGYSQDFLNSCRSELTVKPSEIDSDSFDHVVAVENGSIVGFYALESVSKTTYELSALFVEPNRIGCGIGSTLIEHAIYYLGEKGAKELLIQSDPHVSDFYASVGARHIGTRKSGSIPGRFLPMYQIDIRPQNLSTTSHV